MRMPDIPMRVMQTVCPEFFTWDADQQDLWKISKSDKIDDQIKKLLLAIGLEKSEKDIKSLTRRNGRIRLTPPETEQMNFWYLFFDGIGKDHFYLNEHMADDENVLKFGTLRSYDESNFHFQNSARKSDIPDFEAGPYFGQIASDWARCIKDEKITYLIMSMAHHHIASQLESRFHDLLDTAVPYDYVPGPDHHKQVQKGFFQWDMVLDAKGKEPLHKALTNASHTYIEARREALGAQLHERPKGKVWLYQDMETLEDTTYFAVFSDVSALDVRFSHFLQDCEDRKDSFTIASLLADELKALDCWFFETKEKLEQDLALQK